MTEIVGKNLSKQPIQCWGCGEYHMLRDFPQRDEKVRTGCNVQQSVRIEHMGNNLPRIYTALDNKQVQCQSHMIEVLFLL
jgi:hypothetical protein